jgi:ribosomal protein L11 methyltransferase
MPEQPSGKQWRIVELQIDARQEDMAGWLMMQLGANGCEVQTSSAGRICLRATFDEDKLPGGDTSRLVGALDEYGLNSTIPSMRVTTLSEQDWLAKWKEGFEPFVIGDRVVVCPAWHKDDLPAEMRANRAVVVIDPGLAFGTGFHETTRYCLTRLQTYIDAATRVIDVGAGSAILAIACSLLNPDCQVIAIENDAVACKNARGNLKLNGLDSRVRLVEGTTDDMAEEAFKTDLMLCNLTYEDHEALLDEYLSLAAPGCHLVFAGILEEKADKMRGLLASRQLEIVDECPRSGWIGVTARFDGVPGYPKLHVDDRLFRQKL